ncbi:DUF5709 domain-containing protein [Rugosimonospora acidiphila]
MRTDDTYPRKLVDPAADGIPEVADDDSTAYDEVDSRSGRIAEGEDSMALPGDREDGPMALDEFGLTPDEQLAGQDLESRLAREEPEVTEAGLPTTHFQDSDAESPDPQTGSQVSMYDRPGLDPLQEGRVGRIVQPDEGGYNDTESDQIGYDAGAAGGGAAAEEAAMHQFRDDQVT